MRARKRFANPSMLRVRNFFVPETALPAGALVILDTTG